VLHLHDGAPRGEAAIDPGAGVDGVRALVEPLDGEASAAVRRLVLEARHGDALGVAHVEVGLDGAVVGRQAHAPLDGAVAHGHGLRGGGHGLASGAGRQQRRG